MNKMAKKGQYMQAYKQGEFDALCGVYSLLNADRIINRTSYQNSKQLFYSMMHFLESEGQLSFIISEGTHFRHIKKLLDRVIGIQRIAYQKRHFIKKSDTNISTFWNEMMFFLDNYSNRAILLGMTGVHDHWTVVCKITKRQMILYDSSGMRFLNRLHCTTGYAMGKRQHILHPGQTYFLMKEEDNTAKSKQTC